MSRAVAVFDLDGTLTRRDTSLAFLRAVAGVGAVRRAVLHACARAPVDLAAARRLESGREGPRVGSIPGRWEGLLHQRVVRYTLAGRTRTALEDSGCRFATEVAGRWLRPEAHAWLGDHRARGHRLILASASLEVYLRPLGALLGFDAAVGTLLEFDGDVATGRFRRPNCWGLEKLRRVRDLLAPGEVIEHAYGDSAGDAPLLAAAIQAHRVGRRGLGPPS